MIICFGQRSFSMLKTNKQLLTILKHFLFIGLYKKYEMMVKGIVHPIRTIL